MCAVQAAERNDQKKDDPLREKLIEKRFWYDGERQVSTEQTGNKLCGACGASLPGVQSVGVKEHSRVDDEQ